jgi:hypothetical protein
MKIFLFILFSLVAINAFADQSYHCVYLSPDRESKTTIEFNLPEKVRFGTLVPVTLNVNNKKNTSVSMNTAVIKDKPYVVLSDLYRIKNSRSSIAILMFNPKETDIFLAYINMGFTPSAEFHIGKCNINNEEE